MNSARKYFIGVIILGLLTSVLTVFVVIQAASSKADVKTLKAAQSAADKLNNYTTNNNKIPGSLKEADINDAPETIKYTKKSDAEYQFCAKYQTSNTLNVGGIEEVLFGVATSGRSSQDFYGGTGYSSSSTSYLYISSQYKKGNNCQTIQPYLSDLYPLQNQPSTDLCSPSGPNYDLYKDYCQNVNTPAVNTD